MKRLFTMAALLCMSMGFAQKTLPFAQPHMPLVTEKENTLTTFALPIEKGVQVEDVVLAFKTKHRMVDLANLSVYASTRNKREAATLFTQTTKIRKKVKLSGNYKAAKDTVYFWVTARTTASPDLLNKLLLAGVKVKTSDKKYVLRNKSNEGQRFAITLRHRQQDGIACYRIPGLATTNKGTLIAIYDNRYNNCKDLQEDINVGMSRSTDGGQTWEPMKEVIDMGEWGGKPNHLNGVGDASVLVDEQTNAIWVMGLWQHGLDPKVMTWWGSKPGLTPDETGQIVVVKSNDDGKTWSQPLNVTAQMKNPEWHLFFEGPGRGISMADGTLVFAGQFKDKDQVPHSTIIYSKDHGATWQVGTGAKSHTTEAQVVQLSDGSLMLNMRDDRNRSNYELSDAYNGRSVAVTTDMGKTWIEHSTSRTALVEPNCMASIISYKNKKGKQYLFFSNPADAKKRINLTVKVSDDEGNTWDKHPQVLLYEKDNMGYSCLTVVDNKTLGILYEGDGDLYFQKIAIKEFLK